MKRFLSKPYRWAIVFSILLILFFAYAMLDTFVIPKAVITSEDTNASDSQNPPSQPSAPIITDTSYSDDNIKITIETFKEYNTVIYIADIQLKDASYLKTAFAKNSYGRNIKDITSKMAGAHNAILAVNGDYYGFRDHGYVLRNGKLYRTNSRGSGYDALLIDKSGNFLIEADSEISQSLINSGTLSQIISFGPGLIEDGKITANKMTKSAAFTTTNPRTAIGQISPLHYVFAVCDGRTKASTGLKLKEFAQILYDKGCVWAYNLDGGGSATIYFNGKVINHPSDGSEREISDIVYIGY
ncbi:MAG: phosphodiester glycosidase family protein [Eubacteriaceae bacterium]|nr:phosphodiester glycosidase family protein [Eubacteriaceae bacterium]